MGAFI